MHYLRHINNSAVFRITGANSSGAIYDISVNKIDAGAFSKHNIPVPKTTTTISNSQIILPSTTQLSSHQQTEGQQPA